jgi:hypothetical protein
MMVDRMDSHDLGDIGKAEQLEVEVVVSQILRDRALIQLKDMRSGPAPVRQLAARAYVHAVKRHRSAVEAWNNHALNFK